MYAIEVSLRLYLCARCKRQVTVCQDCDRGQIYCADGCAQIRRKESQQEAGKRYQEGRSGARKHAQRQACYLARNKKVTHQGSETIATAAKSACTGEPTAGNWLLCAQRESESGAKPLCCHFCGRKGQFVRNDYLSTRVRKRYEH